MDTKSPLKSKTLWVGFSALIAGAVALIMHYTGSHELAPELLGAAWTDLLSSAVMVALRFITKNPVSLKGGEVVKDAPKTGILLTILSITLFVSGCSTLKVHAKNSIGVDVANGPPCTVVVTADGKVVATVVGPNACTVQDVR